MFISEYVQYWARMGVYFTPNDVLDWFHLFASPQHQLAFEMTNKVSMAIRPQEIIMASGWSHSVL